MDENRSEKAGLKFLFIIVTKELLNCEVRFCHSLDIGMRGQFITKRKITSNDINLIDKKMKEYISQGFPILKLTVSSKDAINYFRRYDEYEKAKSIENLVNDTITINELLGKYNYFFSDVVDNTNLIKNFKIINLDNNNFVLINNYQGQEFVNKKNILYEFDKYTEWLEKQNIRYVSDLNKIISDGLIEDFIKKNDIMIDDSIMKIAENIIKLKKKIIFLGGPSSSGKTTSTRKLGLYINALGRKTIKLSLDNYYKEYDEIPVDELGKKDFESIKALDLNLFRKNITDLLAGKEVELPRYIFQKYTKIYDGNAISIGSNDILLVEGLHAMNEEISKNIDKKLKYKICISPFTPLTIDRHNYISTSEIRLIRRIIRDNRTRGVSVERTLATWDLVRKSEDKNIFSHTNEANVILNTAYIYEIGVLKVYVEPLLHTISMDSPYYNMARRLLDSLKNFFPISSEYIDTDNVLREFIGKSEFNEG